MIEDQYNQLCKACDDILLADNSNIERICISWLHVIREHPTFLENYEFLFDKYYKGKFSTTISKSVVSLAKRIYKYKNYLKEYPSHWKSSNTEESQEFDVIFVSHLLNKSQVGVSKDLYFNNIPNILENEGFKVGVLLINHTKLNSLEIVNKWNYSKVPRFVLSPILPFFEEIRVRKRLKKESIALKKESKYQDDTLLKKILIKASEETLSNNSRQNYRLTIQLKSLFTAIKPKIVISTFEGHAYERIAFHSAKNLGNDTTCIGYQHASIFKLQHAIRRGLFRNYDPDFIFTSGLIGKQRLEKSSNFKNIKIFNLGSDRGIENEYVSNIPDSNNNLRCLVLPEGTLNECKILFEFSLKCALLNPSVTFVWRLHPILDFNFIIKKIPQLKRLPENIVLSRKSFEEDLKNTNFAIYRGTTAIIKAVSYKIKPIYVHIPGELTIDILYESNYWKKIISKAEDFKEIADGSFEENDEFYKLLNYCRDLFNDFDLDKLYSIIRERIKSKRFDQ